MYSLNILAAGNDGEVSPVNIEAEIPNVIGSSGVKTDVGIIVRCSHLGSGGSQVTELTGHITRTTAVGGISWRTGNGDVGFVAKSEWSTGSGTIISSDGILMY